MNLLLALLGIIYTSLILHSSSALEISPMMSTESAPTNVSDVHAAPGHERVKRINALDWSIARATDALIAQQKRDGHWIYECEADATFPSQYIFIVRYLGETPNTTLEQRIARYLRRTQLPSGGWSLYPDGPTDISPSVQAYLALKMAGDPADAEHMLRARDAIRKAGGAEAANVFTRIFLALFGVVSWDAVPVIPVEIMLLPEWFPFHLSRVSYWARSFIVPLLVVNAERPVRSGVVRIDELFNAPPETLGLPARAPHQSQSGAALFRSVDAVFRFADQLSPTLLRARAIDAAVAFVDERLNGEDGFGAALPAIFNSIVMYDLLGNRTARGIARKALDKLLVFRDDEAYCVSVLGSVWDTSLAAQALLESRQGRARRAAVRGLEWLRPRQVLDVRGDWSVRRPDARPGGWAFSYSHPYNPDVDDTAVVVMAMHRADPAGFAESIARAREWVVSMQGNNGGWGAFSSEEMPGYVNVNDIPFADHDAMLDPPTVDITARALSMLTELGLGESEAARRAEGFLLEEQREDGSWFGRWGVNYVYGTWSALSALNSAGMNHTDERIRRAVRWLVSVQNADGGWGESPVSYRLDYTVREDAPSTASQTAWAVLGLMAAGEVRASAVARGVAWLQQNQQEHGLWNEAQPTGVGFPRVLYLRYHGYPKYFPLMAMARYRNLVRDRLTRVTLGM